MNAYLVRFTSVTSYKATVKASSEVHAVGKAKRRWLHGSSKGFVPFAGDTHDWDAAPLPLGKGGAP